MQLPVILILSATIAAPPPGMRPGPHFGEHVREEWVEPGIRVLVNAAKDFDPKRPTRLVVYATPNGNSIEQTLGRTPANKDEWRFDIQHVAAQVRRLREVAPGENVVLAYVEAEGLSWPAWRRKHTDAPAHVRNLVDALRSLWPEATRVVLTGHSGGGSFLFAFLDAADTIPDWVEAVAFLDANYSYSDRDRHGDKLLAWLRGAADRRLVVIAYDDREITLDGKRVVGPDGGTFRATGRMLARLGADLGLKDSKRGDMVTHAGLDGRAVFHVHANPANRILHTALVGEINGLLEALTAGRAGVPDWGAFGGPRAYAKWVQPAPGIPARPADAIGGAAFMARLTALPASQREEAITAEVLRGNIPEFLRRFHAITVKSNNHTATFEVTPDYLAVGFDADFVRVPMTPMTAQRIADAFGCTLPTRKLVDDIYRAAEVKPEPRPMTEARESIATFTRHNGIIAEQLAGTKPGALVAGLKKDLVVTNRLAEKPNRVAIYGWHKPDGVPIQPLTIVHRDTYVDYSHGVRLVRRTIAVDGRPRDLRHVAHDAELWRLVSDEGPLSRPTYER